MSRSTTKGVNIKQEQARIDVILEQCRSTQAKVEAENEVLKKELNAALQFQKILQDSLEDVQAVQQKKDRDLLDLIELEKATHEETKKELEKIKLQSSHLQEKHTGDLDKQQSRTISVFDGHWVTSDGQACGDIDMPYLHSPLTVISDDMVTAHQYGQDFVGQLFGDCIEWEEVGNGNRKIVWVRSATEQPGQIGNEQIIPEQVNKHIQKSKDQLSAQQASVSIQPEQDPDYRDSIREPSAQKQDPEKEHQINSLRSERDEALDELAIRTSDLAREQAAREIVANELAVRTADLARERTARELLVDELAVRTSDHARARAARKLSEVEFTVLNHHLTHASEAGKRGKAELEKLKEALLISHRSEVATGDMSKELSRISEIQKLELARASKQLLQWEVDQNELLALHAQNQLVTSNNERLEFELVALRNDRDKAQEMFREKKLQYESVHAENKALCAELELMKQKVNLSKASRVTRAMLAGMPSPGKTSLERLPISMQITRAT